MANKHNLSQQVNNVLQALKNNKMKNPGTVESIIDSTSVSKVESKQQAHSSIVPSTASKASPSYKSILKVASITLSVLVVSMMVCVGVRRYLQCNERTASIIKHLKPTISQSKQDGHDQIDRYTYIYWDGDGSCHLQK